MDLSSIQALILTPEMLAELREAVRTALPAEQAETVCACLEIPAWVVQSLQEKNMTIAKLRKLVSGARTESSRNLSGKPPKGKPKGVKPRKSGKGNGHGRLGPDKYPGARWVFMERVRWLRCSSVTGVWRPCSLVAPRDRAFSVKTGPRRISKHA